MNARFGSCLRALSLAALTAVSCSAAQTATPKGGDALPYAEALERARGLTRAGSWLERLRFLRFEHAGGEVFDRLWAGLRAGDDASAALDAALEGRDAPALHASFVELVNRLIRG